MMKIEGGCLCGAVRYSSDAEPVMIVTCHCAACRKNTSSDYSYNLAMPEGSVKVEGETRTYKDNSGASGRTFERIFCPACGSQIMGRGPAYEGLEFVKAGTLDDPGWARPTAHIWTEEKLPWIDFPESDDAFPRNPG